MQDQERPKRPYHFHMPMEEIHEIRSRAGRPKGRKSGYHQKISKEKFSLVRKINASGPHNAGRFASTISPGEERVVFKMLKSTRDTLNKCAKHEGVSALALLHVIALSLRTDPRYAHLFATPTSQPQTR